MNISRLVDVIWDGVTSPLGLNVVGGLLASIVALIASWSLNSYRRRLCRWRFRQIFGPGGNNGLYTLVYAALSLPESSDRLPYRKPAGDPRFGFSISQPVSISEVRAANYLASSIGKGVGSTPSLRSDLEVRADLNLDFVSFGGPASNLKTADCQANDGNRLALFEQPANQFVERTSRRSLTEFERGFDYGIILKVRPAQFPDRVWIMCAGLGEWGTSGAAWFLANKWNEIRKEASSKTFAVIVRVREGQDESAEIVRILVDSKS